MNRLRRPWVTAAGHLRYIAVVVFVGFALVLIPVAAAALFVGPLTIAYGFIVAAHVIGRRFPSLSPGRATVVTYFGVSHFEPVRVPQE